MNPLSKFSMPHKGGVFGAVRKFDRHTGIDLYCEAGSIVRAIEEGTVTHKGQFTGEALGMPWWNDTDFCVIRGKSGFILYGEISADVTVGQVVSEGEQIGKVLTVLKKNKGLPMTMLHLELYSSFDNWVEWKLDRDQPLNLLDPTELIMSIE